ncbi:hypothetical protein FACS189487_03500 [Campylobacterota bacterium]|nr:hypothetical protein FACS189487_03500 [Campylobacterota bacterium]
MVEYAIEGSSMELRAKFLIVAALQFFALSSALYFEHLPLPFFASLFLLSLIVPLSFYCTISAPAKRQIIAISLAAFASILIGIYQGFVLVFDRFVDTTGGLITIAVVLSIVVILTSPLTASNEIKDRYERWVSSFIYIYETLFGGAITLAAGGILVGVMQGLLSMIDLRMSFDTPFFSVAICVFSFALGAFFAQREHATLGRRLAEVIYLLLAAITLLFALIWAFAGSEKINHSFSNILIGLVWVLILFFNLKTRCGLEESSRKTVQILIAASWVAALAMITTAIYGLIVRIAQYSLTPMRIWGLLLAVFAAILAVGYLFSSLPKLPRTRIIAATNISSVFAAIVCVLLMISGAIDPNRISVNYQLARLDVDRDFNGVVKFLHNNNSIFAKEALEKIVAGDQVNARLNSDDQKALQSSAIEAAKEVHSIEKFRGLLQEANTTNGEKLPPDLIEVLVKEWQNSAEYTHKFGKPYDAIAILKTRFEDQETDSWIFFSSSYDLRRTIWQLLDGEYRNVGDIRTNCTQYDPDLAAYIQNNPAISQQRSEIIKIGDLELRADFRRNRIDCKELK